MSYADTQGHASFKRLARERRVDDSISSTAALLDVMEEAPAATEPVAEKLSTTTVPVRRVGLNDIQTLGPWLLPRLNDIWAGVPNATWASRFRSWTIMNDASFLRTENCVGLAIAEQSDMDGKIRVRERFMLARVLPTRLDDRTAHPSEVEMLAIYRTTLTWARAKGAIRFNVLSASDLLPGKFQKYLGLNFVKRDEFFVRLNTNA